MVEHSGDECLDEFRTQDTTAGDFLGFQLNYYSVTN